MNVDEGLKHHQAGELERAEMLYRQGLSREPNNAEALHLLGVLEIQRGRHNAAIELIRHALALNAKAPVYWANLGEALRIGGRLEDAAAAIGRATELLPSRAELHVNHGMLLA